MNRIKLIIKNIRYLCTKDLSMLELKNQKVPLNFNGERLIGILRSKSSDNP